MQTDHLPGPIVEPVEGLARELSRWAAEHPDSTLAEQEQAVQAALRAAAPALLAGLIRSTQRSLDGRQARVRPRCPRCAGRSRVQSWRGRQLKTLCGTTHWERPWAVCPRCRHGFSPTDATLGVGAQERMSVGLRALVVLLGGACAFGEARRLLEATTGLQVGRETLRTVSESAGTALEAAQQERIAQVAESGEAAGAVDRAPGQLVAETDGVMVRYLTGWHEVKIGLVGGWSRGGRVGAADRLLAPSYVAAREPAAVFARRWGAEAARRGALEVVGWRGPDQCEAILRRVVVLGDGARWIWESAAEQFGERIEIVDFYHASEHLWCVARALFGEGSTASQQWGEARRAELLEQGAVAILEQLAALSASTPEQQAVLQREQGYFRANRERMRYPDFRAAGLPIGSGAVESSAKHLVQQRMKRPGARWSEYGASAMLTLRAQQATDAAKVA